MTTFVCSCVPLHKVYFDSIYLNFLELSFVASLVEEFPQFYKICFRLKLYVMGEEPEFSLANIIVVYLRASESTFIIIERPTLSKKETLGLWWFFACQAIHSLSSPK